jgi:enolase
MENKITKILAEEIKDSRGNPTMKVTVFSGEEKVSFSVPSGASTGVHEAYELRDKDGKGIILALDKVNEVIGKALRGEDVLNQKEIDKKLIELDGTPGKDNLGGNSMIGVSIACAKLAARILGVKTFEYLRTLIEIKPSARIPHLYLNLINGGKHAQNGLAFQEYHVVSNTEEVAEAIDIGIKIQDSLRKIIREELGEESLVLGDEGGFAPKITDVRKPLEYLARAIKENDFGPKAKLALDVAASSFYQDGFYKVAGKNITKEELSELYLSLVKEFDLLSIEDPFEEKDFESFTRLKEECDGLIVVGDDLTVTNKNLLEKAINENSINGMIIKPNQIGTLSETLETMRLARENGIELIVSHRSGETEDDFIADLAYAFNCFGLKSGSPIKAERMVKYQRLLKISKI